MKRKAQKYGNKIKHAGICLNRPKANNTGIAVYAKIDIKNGLNIVHGGRRGIRTLDTTFQSYNGLANRRLQPLGHPSSFLLFKANNLNDTKSSVTCLMLFINTYV